MKGTSVSSRDISVAGRKVFDSWKRLRLTFSDFLMSLICGIISQGKLLGILRPFGYSFYAACSGNTAVRILAAGMIFLWNIVRGDLFEALRQTAIILLYEWFRKIFVRDGENVSYLKNSLFVSVATVVTGSFIFIINRQVLESLIVTVIEAVLTCILTHVFAVAIHGREKFGESFSANNNAGYFGVLVLSSALILGLSGIEISWFRIDRTVAGLGLLMLTRHLGPGFGACAGCMTGLALSAGYPDFSVSLAGVYAISGMAAGMFHRSKFATGSVFILVQLLFFILSPDLPVDPFETIIPAVLLMIVPDLKTGKVLTIRSRLEETVNEPEETEKIRNYVSEKIDDISKAFYKLGHALERQIRDSALENDEIHNSAIDHLTRKVCAACTKANVCWDMRLYYTYKVMCGLIDSIQSGNTDSEAWRELNLFCVKSGLITDTLHRIIEIKRVDMVWQKILYENRCIIPDQIFCVSEILSRLSGEILNNIKFFTEEEKNIEAQLRRNGFPVIKAEVKRCENGRFHAVILFEGCSGQNPCRKTLERAVSRVLGVNMTMDEGDCKNRGRELCTVYLKEKENLAVITGISRQKKSNASVSGDSFSFLKTDEGKYVVALSDGMGSGREANRLSETAIGLFEQLLNYGVSVKLALTLVNMLISVKNSEKYATMDVAAIDLYTGETEFFKMGAVPSLIISGNNMDYIQIDNLPAGLDRESPVQCEKRKLTDGELIIMMTDGVYEKLNGGTGERFLDKIISTGNLLNPQEMADNLLNKACSGNENINDDMTVLVAKIWRKAG